MDLVRQPVEIDFSREEVNHVVGAALNDRDVNAPAQTLMDAVSATCVIGVLAGLESPDEIKRLVDLAFPYAMEALQESAEEVDDGEA